MNILPPGRKPTKLEHLVLEHLLAYKQENSVCVGYDDVVIIHHITEDTPERLQIEVEIRSVFCNHPRFERVIL